MQTEYQSDYVMSETGLDTDLEYQSICLLSELEQFAVHLDENIIQSSPGLVLDYLINIANRSVKFTSQLSDTLLSPFTLEALLNEDKKGYMYITKRHVNNNQLKKELVDDLEDTYIDALNMQKFWHICQDILRITKIYLLFNVRAFHCTTTRQQWKRLYGSFFLNLTKTVEDIYITNLTFPYQELNYSTFR